MEIEEKTTMAAWKAALKLVFEKGKDFTDKDERLCRQVLNVLIREENTEDITEPIETMRNTTKYIFPDLSELRKIILTKTHAPAYYYAYGARLFNYNETLDQINDFIIPLFKKDPKSRRGVAIIWNPLKDSNVYNKEIPGHVMLDFKIEDGRLNVTSYIRSNDIFIGWPANIYQMHVLQDYLASRLGIKKGPQYTFSSGAQGFGDNFESIKKLIQ